MKKFSHRGEDVLRDMDEKDPSVTHSRKLSIPGHVLDVVGTANETEATESSDFPTLGSRG